MSWTHLAQPAGVTTGAGLWVVAAIQEIARTQVNRTFYSARYVRSLHLPEVLTGSLRKSIQTIAPQIKIDNYQYIPDGDDAREFFQTYANVCLHPDRERLYAERIKNISLSGFRISTMNLKHFLMRFPLFISLMRSLYKHHQAKQLLSEVTEYNNKYAMGSHLS